MKSFALKFLAFIFINTCVFAMGFIIRGAFLISPSHQIESNLAPIITSNLPPLLIGVAPRAHIIKFDSMGNLMFPPTNPSIVVSGYGKITTITFWRYRYPTPTKEEEMKIKKAKRSLI